MARVTFPVSNPNLAATVLGEFFRFESFSFGRFSVGQCSNKHKNYLVFFSLLSFPFFFWPLASVEGG